MPRLALSLISEGSHGSATSFWTPVLICRVVRVAGHSSLQIVRDRGQACAIVAKRETALPIRWPIWVAFAARVFL